MQLGGKYCMARGGADGATGVLGIGKLNNINNLLGDGILVDA